MQAIEGFDEIQLDGVRVQLFQAGEKNPDGGKQTGRNRGSSENDRSTVARIEYGQYSFLLTGDLEGESEKKLCETNMPHSTVLKVGHHGGRKSSQAKFLAKVAPQYAVISVGADNSFGHPNPETVERLREYPTAVFRTDRDGAIIFRSDGERLSVERTVH